MTGETSTDNLDIEQARKATQRLIIGGSALLLCALVAGTVAFIMRATANEPEPTTFAIGQTVTAQAKDGAVQLWTFEGESDLPVIVRVTAADSRQLVVRVDGPYGFELAYGEGEDEVTLDVVLEAYNVHTVTVGVDGATTYTLSIERASPPGDS